MQTEPPLSAFMARNPHLVCARLTTVRGSSPREEGASMLIAEGETWGTIGGGQLEHLVINAARQMMADLVLRKTMDLPLGPEINQCCGGHVTIELFQPSKPERAEIITKEANDRAKQPHVYVFGAGHTGRAICNLLQFMPVRTILSDDRVAEQDKCAAQVERDTSVLPEMLVHNAPKGSVAIVLTHSHSLDFNIAAQALASGHFAYVGMIGSKTKRTKFARWFRENAQAGRLNDLTCPMAANGAADKRPEVIAAFVVAEVMEQLGHSCQPDRSIAPGRTAAPKIPQEVY